MFGLKPRTPRPAATPAPAIDPAEVAYAHSWNHTYRAWLALTPAQRADMRDRVAYAPNLNSVPRG